MSTETKELDWEPSARNEEWPGCRHCAHFRKTHCDAYPDRIPILFLSGEIDHMIPRPGDHGIQFEPKATLNV